MKNIMQQKPMGILFLIPKDISTVDQQKLKIFENLIFEITEQNIDIPVYLGYDYDVTVYDQMKDKAKGVQDYKGDYHFVVSST